MNRRLFAASFCSVILLASAARAGGNWSVGIGFGGPVYHHRHYHPGWHYDYWAPPAYYYAPPPVVYSPPVVYTQPTVITVPAAQSAAPAMTAPALSSAAAPRENAVAP